MMREKILPWIDILARIYTIIRPKYHNYLAWLVVVGGIGVAAGPWWEPYLRSILNDYLQITVPAPPPTWVGIGLVALGLTYHFFAFRLEQVRWAIEWENIRDHDADVFGKFRKSISDSIFYDIISQLQNDHSYTSVKGDVLDATMEFLSSPENMFLDEEILENSNVFLSQLRALNQFLGGRFFVYPGNQSRPPFRYCMQPMQNMDRGGTGDANDTQLYDGWTTELNGHCDNANEAYRNFIDIVHRRLGRQALN